MRFHAGRRGAVAAQPASPLLGGAVDRGQAAAVGIVRAAALPEGSQCTPARGQPIAALTQRVACFQQGGQVAGQRHAGRIAGLHQHRGQARMGAQREHAPAQRGDAAAAGECAQPLQQLVRGGQRAGRRCIDET